MQTEFDLRKLTQRTRIGGAKAEQEYVLFHKRRGVKLKRKYTTGGTAPDYSKNRG